MKKLNEWAYIDDAQQLHLDIPALLGVMGWPDTSLNRARAVDGAVLAVHDLFPDLPAFVVAKESRAE